MSDHLSQPPFGTADLSNCERELIHLAGSIQPHGVLVVLDEGSFTIWQVSQNAPSLLGGSVNSLLGASLNETAPDVAAQLRLVLSSDPLARPAPMRCHIERNGEVTDLEAMVHRVEGQGLVVELEAVGASSLDSTVLPRQLHAIIAQFTSATTVPGLCDTLAREIKDLAGYDRVMVYRFDPDGHGEVVAEAKEAELESYLGLHYPASDIPQRARDLYLRNRVRVLADTDYAAVPLVPRLSPATGTDLDMSMSYLRSLSPIHIQYLKNMGVTGTLVTSLMKDGGLWGLISCHHYSPRRLSYQARAACELLSEVFATRLAALEANAIAQTVMMVPRVEKQMVETASVTGDWHHALFGAMRALMPTLDATGGALLYEGQTLTTGVVPAAEDLSRLAAWIAEETSGQTFQSAAIGKRDASFAKMASIASGVLALRITPTRLDYVIWFRREQVQTVRWAGDPNKPMILDDPNHLSPRRSFAEWRQQVRGTAKPWSEQDLAVAHLVQASIFDTIQQVQGIRVLIVARQLASVTRLVERAGEPMVIMNERDQLLLLNQPLRRLLGVESHEIETLPALAARFADPQEFIAMVHQVRRELQPWTGEMTVVTNGVPIELAVRADAVPSAEGGTLGTIIMLTDLRERRETEAARRRLSQALQAGGIESAADFASVGGFGEMMAAVLANAHMTVLSLSGRDPDTLHPSAIKSIEALTVRASEVARQMMTFASQPPRKGPR